MQIEFVLLALFITVVDMAHLVLLALLQGLVGVELAFVRHPLQTTLFRLDLQFGDIGILLHDGVVQCMDKAPEIMVIRSRQAAAGSLLDALGVVLTIGLQHVALRPRIVDRTRQALQAAFGRIGGALRQFNQGAPLRHHGFPKATVKSLTALA